MLHSPFSHEEDRYILPLDFERESIRWFRLERDVATIGEEYYQRVEDITSQVPGAEERKSEFIKQAQLRYDAKTAVMDQLS